MTKTRKYPETTPGKEQNLTDTFAYRKRKQKSDLRKQQNINKKNSKQNKIAIKFRLRASTVPTE
jgi:hypothetical protein